MAKTRRGRTLEEDLKIWPYILLVIVMLAVLAGSVVSIFYTVLYRAG
jgi:hypothetical protein